MNFESHITSIFGDTENDYTYYLPSQSLLDGITYFPLQLLITWTFDLEQRESSLNCFLTSGSV